MSEPVNLTANAVHQIAAGFSGLKNALEHRAGGPGTSRVFSGKQVRVGKILSGNTNKYDVELGEPDFDDLTTGAETPSFTKYEGVDPVIACSINQTSYAVDELVYILLIHDKYYIVSGVGGAGGFLIFQFDAAEYPEDIPALCTDRVPSEGPTWRVKVINAPCSGVVEGMDEYGYIEVKDPGGFLSDRDYRDLYGRIGFAQLVSGAIVDYQQQCDWVITWVNFFRIEILLHNILFQEDQIVIKRKKVVVWDSCDMPDEIILGGDCETIPDYY